METKIFENTDRDLISAAELLKNGEAVVIPTETVYGLGTNALDEKAVAKIFEAKGRPSDNPLIVHISKKEDVEALALEVPQKAGILAEKFWPGPLTMIFKKRDCIPDSVSAGLSTVGIRLPENEIARKVISLCGVPVAAPSANISGRPSPTTFDHVFQDMNGRVAGIVKGGDCSVGVESTVIDMTSPVPTVLRPGGVSLEQLREAIGEVRISSELKDDGIPKAPGMKYKHYSPNAKVFILSGSVAEKAEFLKNKRAFGKVGALIFDEERNEISEGIETLSLGSKECPGDAARRLFDLLRECDVLGLEEVFAPEIPDSGLWRAVKNRLYKAAAGRIIDARITYTEMKKEHLEGLVKVEEECFVTGFGRETFLREFENKLAYYLVAQRNEEILGYAGLWNMCGCADIMNVGVLPDARRQGIAKTLLKGLEKYCRAKDIGEINLEVRVSNTAARELYKGLGYAEISVRKGYYDGKEDGVCMKKILTEEGLE